MKDQSGNENNNKITILDDLSMNIIINPLFYNLEDCSNNINKKPFNIKLQDILGKIKKERKNRNPFNIGIKRKKLLDALIENIDINYNKTYKTPRFNKKIFMFNRLHSQPHRRNSVYIPPKILEKVEEEETLVEIPEKIKVNIKRTVENIADLLKLIEDFPLKDTIEYNIDMKSINNIKEPLKNLNNMIGMEKLKNNIVNQIIYFIQKLHLTENTKNGDFMHTVIYGPPGTGKTEIAKIIGKIFCGLGVLKKNKFKKATRADLIAGYLGQTALKTKELVEECLGGVLFIDEAYALGNMEKRDSFAKECIDTLCEALSDNKENLMVIIAGYEEELDKCFFSYNQGLNSRFPWRFKTDDYKANELKLIFEKKVKDIEWSFDEKIKLCWFEKNMEYFKFYGRDMETLLSKIKIAHSKRVFCKAIEFKTKLIMEDIQKGFIMFIDNKEVKNRKNKTNINEFMYI
jgi:SpoVK/Ycf46/Vps4 family AAA+-type ATPase